MNKQRIGTAAGFGIFLAAALVVLIRKPFSPDLDALGQTVIGGLLITIGIWIFKPFHLSFSVGGFFLAGYLLTAGITPSIVFSGFTQSAVWTMVAALLFGYVLSKTGLGRHLTFLILGRFRPSYPSLTLAFVLIGTALSILTPSITVRTAIVMPIAVDCCEMYGIPAHSKENSFLQLVAFSMALIPGTGWLSGSLWGPIISGLYEASPSLEGMVTFSSWFSSTFLPMEVTAVLLILGGFLVLRPGKGQEPLVLQEPEKEKQQGWTRDEKIGGLILCLAFLFFLTKNLHGIPDAAVCMFAVVLFFVFGILEPGDLGKGISWDLVLFIGFSLSLGSVFEETGISAWLSAGITGALEPISHNPWVFVYALLVILFLWHFVDVAMFIPTMALLMPVLPAVYEAYHVHPLIWITLFVMAGNSFFLPYQNMWVLMSESIAGERKWRDKDRFAYGWIYFAACLCGLLAAVPPWQQMGLLF
jgi:anion transporter